MACRPVVYRRQVCIFLHSGCMGCACVEARAVVAGFQDVLNINGRSSRLCDLEKAPANLPPPNRPRIQVAHSGSWRQMHGPEPFRRATDRKTGRRVTSFIWRPLLPPNCGPTPARSSSPKRRASGSPPWARGLPTSSWRLRYDTKRLLSGIGMRSAREIIAD